MREKIAIAALIAAGMAFLVVLVSPTPTASVGGVSASLERSANLVQAEANALGEDRGEFESIKSRSETLGFSREGSASQRKGTDELARELVEKEIDRRWGEFQESLKNIRKYEKGKK